ncbi:Ctr copper transporter family-domain-containing protein [Annulohypoxylon maeteangense]|uniref:Ctr copper transporter family-domain-containing protein n=1 Tax=Annulohypoxylon maeteangense TaxID=1927788 RepID=UPI0020076413|nr:Ctr copper transporter family-domain-containing protein [Annulohypoxylon maeteangense]KAI0885904.1 Ctr copper transporter family-domain-containing protein [Annulohypoxylon maeteangense]
MDMSTSMSMSMSMDMSSTATATAAASTSTGSSMDMSGMSMGGDSCKISMLWNWNTIDACFLASSWHITSSGMFAGSCIGVILLTMSLEFLRRTVKEYDRYLVRKHTSVPVAAMPTSSKDSDSKDAITSSAPLNPGARNSVGFRPTIFEQAIRALLHMVQFAVAYFIMLLAMYFNGYIIICIFIGAYIGAFIFHWEYIDGGRGATSASQEPTVCCA